MTQKESIKIGKLNSDGTVSSFHVYDILKYSLFGKRAIDHFFNSGHLTNFHEEVVHKYSSLAHYLDLGSDDQKLLFDGGHWIVFHKDHTWQIDKPNDTDTAREMLI